MERFGTRKAYLKARARWRSREHHKQVGLESVENKATKTLGHLLAKVHHTEVEGKGTPLAEAATNATPVEGKRRGHPKKTLTSAMAATLRGVSELPQGEAEATNGGVGLGVPSPRSEAADSL